MTRSYAGLVAGLLLVTACGGPVEVDVPDLSATDADACEAFSDDLPDTLADRERVDVEPADAPAAAYGDPPIVVTCGAGVPEDFGPGAQCLVANEVPWYVPPDQYDDVELDLVLTAAWHEPRVQVEVPAEERGAEAGVMAVLAPLVAEHLRPNGKCDL